MKPWGLPATLLRTLRLPHPRLKQEAALPQPRSSLAPPTSDSTLNSQAVDSRQVAIGAMETLAHTSRYSGNPPAWRSQYLRPAGLRRYRHPETGKLTISNSQDGGLQIERALMIRRVRNDRINTFIFIRSRALGVFSPCGVL